MDVNERDVIAALRKAAKVAGRVDRISRDLPEEDGRRMRRSAHATAVNLAMALDALRRDPGSGPHV